MDKKEKEDIVIINPPFVGVADLNKQIKMVANDTYIKKGYVVCSIEGMKIYNDIKSPVSGTIIEIHICNQYRRN